MVKWIECRRAWLQWLAGCQMLWHSAICCARRCAWRTRIVWKWEIWPGEQLWHRGVWDHQEARPPFVLIEWPRPTLSLLPAAPKILPAMHSFCKKIRWLLLWLMCSKDSGKTQAGYVAIHNLLPHLFYVLISVLPLTLSKSFAQPKHHLMQFCIWLRGDFCITCQLPLQLRHQNLLPSHLVWPHHKSGELESRLWMPPSSLSTAGQFPLILPPTKRLWKSVTHAGDSFISTMCSYLPSLYSARLAWWASTFYLQTPALQISDKLIWDVQE